MGRAAWGRATKGLSFHTENLWTAYRVHVKLSVAETLRRPSLGKTRVIHSRGRGTVVSGTLADLQVDRGWVFAIAPRRIPAFDSYGGLGTLAADPA